MEKKEDLYNKKIPVFKKCRNKVKKGSVLHGMDLPSDRKS